LKAHKKNFVKNKHELLPIPQEEIDLSAGSLKQNIGY
jgi:starch-binding outer membrane protein, SusD/RagB family